MLNNPTAMGCTYRELLELIAMVTFRKQFSELSDDRQKTCRKFCDMSLTCRERGLKSQHCNGVGVVSEDAKRTANEMIALLQARLDRLTVDYNKQVEDIRQSIRQIKITAGILPADAREPTSHQILELFRKSRAEAAKWALEKIGQPAATHEIAEYLAERGYSPESDLKTLTNSLHVAMGRITTDFVKHGKKWELVEWDSNKKGSKR